MLRHSTLKATMNPRHCIYILTGFILFLFSSDIKAQDSPDLIFDWKIISYEEASSTSAKEIGLEDYLRLKEDGSFSLEIASDGSGSIDAIGRAGD